MSERGERKLHPVIEFLIIAGIIFVLSLCSSFIMSKIISDKHYSEIESIVNISGWINILIPFIASFVCIKLIERRKTGVLKIFVVVLCVIIFYNNIEFIGINYIGRVRGIDYLAKFNFINFFVSPLVTAFLITLFIYIFDLTETDAYIYDEKMYCGLFKHVLLLLFSFGIWRLIWIYRITKYLNCVEDEEKRKPLTKLLLCMFVPFYSIYWIYKSAMRIDKLAKTVDVISDLTVVCVILEIFVPIIPPVLMQDKINKIITSDSTGNQ